jgi:LysM repeat protein
MGRGEYTFLLWIKEQAKTGWLFLFRLLLGFSIAYCPLWAARGAYVYTPKHKPETQAAEQVILNNAGNGSKNGVGGGLIPALDISSGMLNSSDYMLAADFEVSGIPEPPEYSKPRMLNFSSYKVVKGDTISDIAVWAGLREDTILSVNKIRNSRLLQINQVLKIPNQDGIYHTVAKTDTLSSISAQYKVEQEAVITVNELFSDSLSIGSLLFIPGARLDWLNKQEINGDLFNWPVSGYITSYYGYRSDPFGSGDGRQFHSGLDISAPNGSPIRAAMSGRVSAVAFDETLGNYVVISHYSGYRTLYAHMGAIIVKPGAYVNTGERIGDIGMSGMSTGPHVHFTVFKNGVTVNPRTMLK